MSLYSEAGVAYANLHSSDIKRRTTLRGIITFISLLVDLLLLFCAVSVYMKIVVKLSC
jgi:hypothetical protein